MAPVPPDVLCAALCEAMGERRARAIRFRTSSFPPGTASGIALDLGDKDLIVVEKNTAPDHQVIITGHELRHLELGHCHTGLAGTPAAARLLRHDAELKEVIEAVLAVAGRHSPLLAAPDEARAAQHVKEEQEVEQYGLALAHAVRHLLPGAQTRIPDLGTPAGRIEAALGYRGARG
ncbi:toxin-antitoxin system, toxin component [Streptomyces sp. NPDC086783]|uniref:toxin-antitoxin system, toxin component n=1 Tax=Streptomyces sp. NPDC086783 TaxID=3365758 RepID=UPI0037F23A69